MHKLKTDIQHNEKGQKGKQRFTKEYTKNKAQQIRTALKMGVNSGAPEGLVVPAPLVATVVVL